MNDKQMPCGHCPAGTYARGAIEDGEKLFSHHPDRRSALRSAPRCVNRNKQICMGCRDYIVAHFLEPDND